MKKGIDYIGVTVSFICHDGKGNYLMNKRSVNCRDEHGAWDFGGGGLELGETVEDCLKKEIKEEYGADVISSEFLGYLDVMRRQNDTNTHWVSLNFLCLIDPQQVINGEPHKFEELKWFKLDNLPTPLHSVTPKILSTFREKLI